jgi:hypothetical protein
VGREDEIAKLREMIQDIRFVKVVATGERAAPGDNGKLDLTTA